MRSSVCGRELSMKRVLRQKAQMDSAPMATHLRSMVAQNAIHLLLLVARDVIQCCPTAELMELVIDT
jgi:hypothetical protein